MTYLIDTNVLSEVQRAGGNPSLLDWFAIHSGDGFLSVLTLGEMERGMLKLPPGARRTALSDWIRGIELSFAGRILAVDERIALEWARLQTRAAQAGAPMQVVDCLIAATAVVHGLTVVTRNVRDFEYAGVPIENPWRDG